MYCPHCHIPMRLKLEENVNDFSIFDAFDTVIEDISMEDEDVVKVYICKKCGFIAKKEE